MRKLFLFVVVLFLFSTLIIKAQDTIERRDGEKIIAKLIEVNPTDVRYKRFDYQEGPLFTLQKQDIKFIIYGNGKRESFENFIAPPLLKQNYPPLDLSMQTTGKYYYYKERRISEPDMLAVASKLNDPKINFMIKKVEEKRYIQNATMIGAGILLVSGFYIYESNLPKRTRRYGGIPTASSTNIQGQTNGKYLMFAALGSEMASFYFIFDRRRHAHIVVSGYNKEISIR